LGEISSIFIVVTPPPEISMFNERSSFDLLVVLVFIPNWACLKITETKASGKKDKEK